MEFFEKFRQQEVLKEAEEKFESKCTQDISAFKEKVWSDVEEFFKKEGVKHIESGEQGGTVKNFFLGELSVRVQNIAENDIVYKKQIFQKLEMMLWVNFKFDNKDFYYRLDINYDYDYDYDYKRNFVKFDDLDSKAKINFYNEKIKEPLNLERTKCFAILLDGESKNAGLKKRISSNAGGSIESELEKVIKDLEST